MVWPHPTNEGTRAKIIAPLFHFFSDCVKIVLCILGLGPCTTLRFFNSHLGFFVTNNTRLSDDKIVSTSIEDWVPGLSVFLKHRGISSSEFRPRARSTDSRFDVFLWTSKPGERTFSPIKPKRVLSLRQLLPTVCGLSDEILKLGLFLFQK